jgi:hypothetical protein
MLRSGTMTPEPGAVPTYRGAPSQPQKTTSIPIKNRGLYWRIPPKNWRRNARTPRPACVSRGPLFPTPARSPNIACSVSDQSTKNPHIDGLCLYPRLPCAHPLHTAQRPSTVGADVVHWGRFGMTGSARRACTAQVHPLAAPDTGPQVAKQSHLPSLP